ncbi:MAG: ABC transporter permease [Candidatus Geothermarchaeales archaeon]
MRAYVARRLVYMGITLFVITSIVFLIFQVLSPVNPVDIIIDPKFKPEVKEALRSLYGLDEPLYVRYFKYIKSLFLWDFGYSFKTEQPIVTELLYRLANTVLLLGSALVLTTILGIIVGVFAAARRGKRLDVLSVGVGLFTWGVPTFFIQLLFLLFFSYYTYINFGVRVFPLRGMTSIPPPTDLLGYITDVLWHLAQPLLTLVIVGFGGMALYTRNMMLNILTQDYVVTARAKGVDEGTVLYRHAFRSILPPIVTMLALAVPSVVTGAIITEYIFTWPGIGSWYIGALLAGDYPVVQTVLYLYAVLMLLSNFAADLIYAAVDPRIRISGGR